MAKVKLVTLKAEEWPREAGWLVPGPGGNCTELQHQIVLRALKDNGIQENPLGSNRGIRIDRMTRRAGYEPPQWWCAIWVGAVYVDCGALVPDWYGSTDRWLPFIESKPCIGAAILYGVRKKGPVVADMNSHHIGIVAMLSPMMLTIEGNRGYAGTTNNGQAVDLGPPNRSDILGYFHPRKADGTR